MSDPELNELRNAVEEMDCLAGVAFSEIGTIARLALAAMELPRTSKSIDLFASAFESIAARASAAENDVNVAAERVGCNYLDRASALRYAARRVAEGKSV